MYALRSKGVDGHRLGSEATIWEQRDWMSIHAGSESGDAYDSISQAVNTADCECNLDSKPNDMKQGGECYMLQRSHALSPLEVYIYISFEPPVEW